MQRWFRSWRDRVSLVAERLRHLQCEFFMTRRAQVNGITL